MSINRRLLFTSIPLFLVLVFFSVPGVFADSTYVVQPGDTLFRIALNHDLTTQELAEANGIINPSRIYAGQVLVIPGGSSPTDQEVESILHLVEPGDTLFKIAVRFGVNMHAIAEANDITNYDLVFAGQYLTIPGATGSEEDEPQPVSSTETEPLPEGFVETGSAERWIDVNLTSQTLTAFEGNQAVMSTKISSGAWPYLTVTGQYQIYLRYRYQDMDGYRLGYDYYLPNVPYVMYFYNDFALHGTYWHNNFGYPMSHGCVNLTIADAEWLFNWSNYGTPVNVHY